MGNAKENIFFLEIAQTEDLKETEKANQILYAAEA